MARYKVELVAVRKQFGDFVAVDQLSLGVEAGETVALLGPSGCGKSTTLNMIVGLETPTSGEILIDGRSVTGVPAGRRNVGLVFQDYAVFLHMTVRQNLSFGLRVRGTPKREIEREVLNVARLLELEDALDAIAKNLGASELQRVAIGRALVMRPEILLLDEPLSNLEAAVRNTMREELRRLQAETGQTVIYVTHDQVEALSLAHRIAVMNAGKLLQYDTGHHVYHCPESEFVGSFLGNPPMNFFRGSVRDRGRGVTLELEDAELVLPDNHVTCRLVEGQKVTVGIRPETISIAERDRPDGFVARVVLVEPRGPEKVVTAALGRSEFRAVVPAQEQIKEGAEVAFVGRPDRVVVFDTASGVRLGDRGLRS